MFRNSIKVELEFADSGGPISLIDFKEKVIEEMERDSDIWEASPSVESWKTDIREAGTHWQVIALFL
jgi:hypothetical protein